jgi:hypothetical protein
MVNIEYVNFAAFVVDAVANPVLAASCPPQAF